MSPHRTHNAEKHPPRDKYTKLLCYLKHKKHDKFARFIHSHEIDVNHEYGSPENGTLLEIACRLAGNSKFIEALIQHNDIRVNSLNSTFGKAPIHDVVINDDVETLRVLLQSGKCDPHVQDRYGNCVLHYAAVRKNIPMVRILKQHLDADIVAWKLVDRALVDLANYHTSDQMRNELQGLLQHNTTVKLFAMLYNRQTDKFIERIKQLEAGMGHDFLYDNDGYNNYLQYACKAGYGNVVATLLAMEINPNNYWYMNPMNPLMISAFQGYHRILQVLLDYPDISLKPIGKHNVLHCLFYGMFMNRNLAEQQVGDEPCDYRICLNLLYKRIIQRNKIDVNSPDEKGYTALHYAVYLNHKDSIRLLIDAGADVCLKNCKGQRPLNLIDSGTLEEYLDNCISFNEVHCGDKNHVVIFRYNIFTPKTEKSSAKSTNPTQPNDADKKNQIIDHVSEIRALVAMIEIKELRYLLDHPVIVSFITLKWHVVKKFFFVNAIFYLIFALTLNVHFCLAYIAPKENETSFMYNISINILNQTLTNLKSSINSSKTELLDGAKHCLERSFDQLNNTQVDFNNPSSQSVVSLGNLGLQIAAWFLLLMLVCRELFQISVHPRYYIKGWENWLILMLIILTGISLKKPFANQELDNILTAITVFVIWLEFLIILGRYPPLSTNQEKIKKFSYSFFKFIHWFSLIILGYAISLYVKFRHRIHYHVQKLFSNPFVSSFQWFILTPGNSSGIEAQEFVEVVYLAVLTYITIILFNILNGLAVDDVQKIRSEAKLIRNIARIKFISHLETIAFAVPKYYFKFYKKLTGNKRGRNCIDKFYSGLHLFPYIFADHGVHVSPNNGNQVLYVTTDENVCHGGSYMVLSRWKVDSKTVENAMKIYEKQLLKNDYDNNYDRMIVELTNQTQMYETRIENLEKQIDRLVEDNTRTQLLQDQNNQLLKEIMDHVQSKS